MRKNLVKVTVLISMILASSMTHANENMLPNEVRNVQTTQQESIKVTGVVTSGTDGEPLIGVSITIKGAKIGTTTNFDGEYTINATSPDDVLVFSYVGFEKKDIKVGNKTTHNVVLQEDLQMFDEVVVVGYGVQSKLNMTGAVSTVGAGKLENRATPNLSTSLNGLATGVNISQSSGNPGSEGISFTIRGKGSFNDSAPMVLVDGVSASMNDINPDDVESITFLKDGASAAIYGSRAANGVILITTKKGMGDTTPRVTYNNIFASQKPVTDWKLMSNMPDWMSWHNQAQINSNPATTSLWYNQNTIDAWAKANENPNAISEYGIPNWLAFPNTDWATFIFKPSFFQRHNISVTGGGKTSNYLMSLGYQNNPGTLENTKQERFNIRVNAETLIADRVRVGTQTYATKTRKDPGSTSMTYLLQVIPGIYPKYDGKYGFGEDPSMDGRNNILTNVASTGGLNESTTINTTWFINANLGKGFGAEAKVNYRDIFANNKQFSRNIPMYRFRESLEVPIDKGTLLDNADLYRSSSQTYSYLLDFIGTYNNTFGDHNINSIFGYEQAYWQSSGFNATRRGMIDWELTDITSGTEMRSVGGSAEVNYAMISYFGRINYAYKSRYLFEANFRGDASSRFAPHHRWGWFPSFSAAWRMSDEAFFEPVKNVLNDFKIRASWGKLGNVASSYYSWQALYMKTNGVLGNAVSPGLAVSQSSNDKLSWESVATTDFGFDAYLIERRLNVEFDVYQRKTSNILDTPPIPLTMGNLAATWVNSGTMVNKGTEVALNWTDNIEKFSYRVNFNATYNTNKVTKFRGALEYGPIEGEFGPFGDQTYGYSNLSKVSTGGSTLRVEGHMIDEFFLNKPYSGTETYYFADGKVDPNGGPRKGMIRTKADLLWVKAMLDAGYKFNGATVDMPTNNNGNIQGGRSGFLWYGDMIAADVNGDGNYGTTNDRVFTGKSGTPKWTFGSSISAEWKGVDFSMIWQGRLGSYSYINGRGINGNISNDIDAIPYSARWKYYQYDAVASIMDFNNYDPATDPNAFINGVWPRLLAANSVTPSTTYWLYNTSYLKLRSMQVGYTLPKNLVKKAMLERVRVFMSGENLLTIKAKDFPAVDPELGGSVIVYPISRMFSGGINITF